MNVLARTDEIARIENLIENKSVLNASIDIFRLIRIVAYGSIARELRNTHKIDQQLSKQTETLMNLRSRL